MSRYIHCDFPSDMGKDSSSNLTEEEKEYLKLAEEGDYGAVQDAVVKHNININCLDHTGRSALELALTYNHTEIVEFLLPRSNMRSIEDALLFAIANDNVPMCEVILEHPLYKNQRVQLQGSDGFLFQKDTDGPRLRPNTTPIVLAAQQNNFHVVKLLLSKGAKISHPHDYFCECVECGNQRVFDSVKYSRSRLNTFRALASPAYLSLSHDDPILAAFELSHELEGLSEIEKEYKSEYKHLSEGCKNYVVELLDLCRSTDEIIAILNEDESHHSGKEQNGLARVKLALKYEQKRFIAHATCQRQLISLWYTGMPWMRHQHVIIKLLAVPVATILLPFLAIIYLLFPSSIVSNTMRSPFVKFLNYTCGYVVFLILVFITANRGGSGNTWLDMACAGVSNSLPDSMVSIFIFIWVLGMFFHECKQIYREGPKDYLTDWWNWMDSVIIMMYLASYSLQLVVLFKVGMADKLTKQHLCPSPSNFTCGQMDCIVQRTTNTFVSCSSSDETCRHVDEMYRPQNKGPWLDDLSNINQLSDIFVSLANVLSFARIAHLLPANEQLGPLLVSMGRMLQDGARFGVLFLLVFCAFMCGLTTLYRVHRCENKHFSRLEWTLNTLFWATFGMGDTKATELDNRYLGVDKNLITSHSTHDKFTVVVGYALFWTYIAAAVVILLNMLIAMMSNSFQEIYDDRDVEWKFARARLWIDYFEQGCTLPPPLNLIPSPKYIWRLFAKLLKCRKDSCLPCGKAAKLRRQNGMASNDVEMAKSYANYRAIIKRLVNRYIYQWTCNKIEADITGLKDTMQMLAVDSTKLRKDVNVVKSMLNKYIKAKNGYIERNERSRIELHV